MLTKKQKSVLDFIRAYSQKKGYAPSLENIQKHFGLASVSTAHFHVSRLKERGNLDKIDNKARAISISRDKLVVKIPLLGIISAGGPIEAISNSEPIEVPRSMLSRGGEHYALKVEGVSMIEEGISDGDIVIVRQQQTVEDGEKAIAYLPDKDAVTLKKLYRDKNRVKLVPANKYMEPFYEKNVQVQGKVIGVLRKE